MGSSTWNDDDWSAHTTRTASKPREEIFKSYGINADLDPKNFKVRESCDSAANPNSTPIQVYCDVTGSMGELSELLVKTGLGILFSEIRERKPVPDPHILVGAIGDSYSDRAPIQVSQFEADIRIAEQLEKIYLEGNGGNNRHESYQFAHYVAAFRTKIDSWNKRQKKGYLFTIGDEPPQPTLTAEHILKFTGDVVQADMTAAELVEVASRMWHCYHIVIEQGAHVRMFGIDAVIKPWRELLGQNAVVLSDTNALAELVVSIIEINEGADLATVTKSWGGGTDVVIRDALNGLTASGKAGGAGTGVATL